MNRCVVVSLGRHHPSSRIRLQAYDQELLRLGWRFSYYHFHSGMGRPPAANRWQRIQTRILAWWHSALLACKLRLLGPRVPLIVSREMPISPSLLESVPNPLILDIDDGLYLGPGRELILRLCRRAELVVCGNSIIEDALRQHSRATRVIPTVVDCSRFRPVCAAGSEGPIRLGWLGSSLSVDFTLKPFLPVLQRLRGRLDFRLVVVVDGKHPYLEGCPWIEPLEWSPRLETRLGELFDIGLMPLQADAFQAAKCGCKLIQYMACGLPSVATAIGVNASILGEVGWVAESETQWRQALCRLADDRPLRESIGARARQRAVTLYSTQAWAPRWSELLNGLSR